MADFITSVILFRPGFSVGAISLLVVAVYTVGFFAGKFAEAERQSEEKKKFL
jgi:Na+-transporting methylmalonyl-CoA/oxaloacetate decarboxylase gamma subunit